MFDGQLLEWSRLLGWLYPCIHLLWLGYKQLRKVNFKGIDFLIRKTSTAGEFRVAWGQKHPDVLLEKEIEPLALPKPKSTKRKQAK